MKIYKTTILDQYSFIQSLKLYGLNLGLLTTFIVLIIDNVGKKHI